LRDRGQWFVDLGSAAAPDEWFDSRLALDYAGITTNGATGDEAYLTELFKTLAENSARWEPLFAPATYDATRRALRSLEIASARERFGYSKEE
jgi:hypothetical protein